jgi:hypothetical protein
MTPRLNEEGIPYTLKIVHLTLNNNKSKHTSPEKILEDIHKKKLNIYFYYKEKKQQFVMYTILIS